MVRARAGTCARAQAPARATPAASQPFHGPRSRANAAARALARPRSSIPEDLYCLIKKAVQVRKHLDKFRQDKDAKFRLIIESRIHRLAATTRRSRRCP